MEFIDPEVLGSFDKFDRTFIVRDDWGRPKRYRNLHLIQKRLGPAMYRKSREDIKEWLPEKIEIEMPVVLDRTTMRLHDLIRSDLSDAIDKALAGGVSGGSFDVGAHYGRYDTEDHTLMGQVMSRLLAMRMLSSHPHLLRRQRRRLRQPAIPEGSAVRQRVEGCRPARQPAAGQRQARRPDRDGRPRSSMRTPATRSWCSPTSSRCWR